MQSPPQIWSVPPASQRPNTTKIVLIVLAAIGGAALICCGGGAYLLWHSGPSDLLACSNLTTEGKFAEAIPACRAVVKRTPDLAAGHNDLGWCLAIEGQVQEGLAESRKAVELEPSRTHYDTLAMALALSGQGQEALQIETDHVMVNGEVENDSERVTLGMVYYSVGKKADARRQWDQAISGSKPVARKLAQQFESKYR